MSACERDAEHGSAVHAVCLSDDGDAAIVWWCDGCVERVVYGLDDPVIAGRYVAHRALPLRIGDPE